VNRQANGICFWRQLTARKGPFAGLGRANPHPQPGIAVPKSRTTPGKTLPAMMTEGQDLDLKSGSGSADGGHRAQERRNETGHGMKGLSQSWSKSHGSRFPTGTGHLASIRAPAAGFLMRDRRDKNFIPSAM
jgi:hypothetical protein